jgi:hypothetical protein
LEDVQKDVATLLEHGLNPPEVQPGAMAAAAQPVESSEAPPADPPSAVQT